MISVIAITASSRVAAYIENEIQFMEAPMITTINSRAAIQARIAEWQRQYRNSDYGAADLLFGAARSGPERVRWFRAAA